MGAVPRPTEPSPTAPAPTGTSLTAAGPAERHRLIAGTFSDRFRGVVDWTAPAPVIGWTARDVVRHLVEWFPGFLAMGSAVRLPAGPSVEVDPIAAWQVQADGVQNVLDDPSSQGVMFSNEHIGTLPLTEAIDRFYTVDIFMHTWDLARASGQDAALDLELSAVLLAGMEPIEDMMRGSGQYGPRVDVPSDADMSTRLLGFIGRDPGWTPPTT